MGVGRLGPWTRDWKYPFCAARIFLLCTDEARIAQLVEQRIRNAKVVGSTPISGTNKINGLRE